jgi:hypothetical protein
MNVHMENTYININACSHLAWLLIALFYSTILWEIQIYWRNIVLYWFQNLHTLPYSKLLLSDNLFLPYSLIKGIHFKKQSTLYFLLSSSLVHVIVNRITPKFKKPKLFICCFLFIESFSLIASPFLFYNAVIYLWIWRVKFTAFSIPIFNPLLMALFYPFWNKTFWW